MAVLALLWGSSFVFIRVAVRDLDPGEVLASRMVLGALTLAPFVIVRFGFREAWARLRPIWPKVVAMGVVTFFVPTTLLAWGEQRIDAGLTAILIAGAPPGPPRSRSGSRHTRRSAGGGSQGCSSASPASRCSSGRSRAET